MARPERVSCRNMDGHMYAPPTCISTQQPEAACTFMPASPYRLCFLLDSEAVMVYAITPALYRVCCSALVAATISSQRNMSQAGFLLTPFALSSRTGSLALLPVLALILP